MEVTEAEHDESQPASPAAVVDFLRTCPLFATLADRELERIVPLCRQDTYQLQEVIFRQGEPSESLYLVVEGTVALARHIKGRQDGREVMLVIGMVGRGDAFGWSALIKPHVHTGSAVCERQTIVLTIDGAKLRLIMEKDNRIGYELMSNLTSMVADRLKATYRLLEAKL